MYFSIYIFLSPPDHIDRMAFISTYFATTDAMQKAVLLSMMLTISSTLTLVCLHMPKARYTSSTVIVDIIVYK